MQEAGVLRFEVSALLLSNVNTKSLPHYQGRAGLAGLVGDKTLAGYQRVESSAPASTSLFCLK